MENGTVAGRDFDLQTFQGLILALEDYWAGRGGVLQQPSFNPRHRLTRF